MVHAIPSMLYKQAGASNTPSQAGARRVLLTLEETQNHYTLLLEEHHTQGIRSRIVHSSGDGQWMCYVLTGIFAFSLEDGHVSTKEHFLADRGDIVALPADASSWSYELVGPPAAGQLLILQTPSIASTAQRFRRVKADEGKSLAVITDIGTFKIVGSDTHNAYIAMLWRVPPQGGVAIHTQSGEETFYILEGNFAFRGKHEGQAYILTASKGDVVHAPERVPHSYQNTGDVAGTMIVIMSPAGRTQQFFEEIGTPSDGMSFPTTVSLPDPMTFMEILQKYDIAIFP